MTAAKTKPKRKTTRTRKAKDERKIKYIIQQKSGEFCIEIPASWKVTFSSVNPSSNGAPGYDKAYCVRVWEGQALRAVFDNVVNLRDSSIPLARKLESQTTSGEWKQDSEGNFEGREKRQIESSIVVENDDVFSFEGN